MRITWTLIVIYVNLFLYGSARSGFDKAQPFILQEKIGSEGSNWGDVLIDMLWIQMVVQHVGAPAVGLLLDSVGARLTGAFCFLCTGIAQVLYTLSPSLEVLYGSKLLTMFQHGYIISQLALAQEETHAAARAGVWSYAFLTYSISWQSPAKLGQLLGVDNGRSGGLLAAATSVLSGLLALLLPRGRPRKANGLSGGTLQGGFRKICSVVGRAAVHWVLLMNVVLAIGSYLTFGDERRVNAVMGTVLVATFGDHSGIVAESLGLCWPAGAVAAAVVVRPLVRWLRPRELLRALLAARAFVFLAFAAGYGAGADLSAYRLAWLFSACGFLHCALQALLKVVSLVVLTSAVEEDECGTALGLVHAVDMLPGRVIQPVPVELLLHLGWVPLVWSSAAALTLGCLAIAVFALPRPHEGKDL